MDRRSTLRPTPRTTLRAELLESRDVPSAVLPGSNKPIDGVPLIQQHRERFAVAATDSRGVAQVNVYDAGTNALLGVINPFGSANAGSPSVATGDVTGDGVEDVIVASGRGLSPVVKVFDGKTLTEVGSFTPFSKTFHGGVSVAVGDVTGDGRADIVVGAGAGSVAQVKVFDARTLIAANGKVVAAAPAPVRNFVAFDSSYRGGVTVAAGDMDGDGRAEVIVGKMANSPDVRAFDGKTGATVADFTAFDASFPGGVSVAAGDLDGDGKAEIVAGANGGPANNVAVYSGSVMVAQFNPGTGTGARVATTDLNGDGKKEIVAASGSGSRPKVVVMDGTTGAARRTFPAMTTTYRSGLSVG